MRNKLTAALAILGVLLFVSGLSDMSFIGVVLVGVSFAMHASGPIGG